jgi:hypothetical protein
MAFESLFPTYSHNSTSYTYFQPDLLIQEYGGDPFQESGEAGNFNCTTGWEGHPDLVEHCPDFGAIDIHWEEDLDNFHLYSPSPSINGCLYSAPTAPSSPPPDLPFNYLKFFVESTVHVNFSRWASNGCQAVINPFPVIGPPIINKCGDNIVTGHVNYEVDIGVPIAPLVPAPDIGNVYSDLGDISQYLEHASDDPDDWDFTDEPGNPESRQLFSADRDYHITFNASNEAFHKFTIVNSFRVIPYSYTIFVGEENLMLVV